MAMFIQSFEDELTKQAAHPLLQSVVKGGTALGQKVKGMVTRTLDRGNKIRKKTMKKMGEERPLTRVRAIPREHSKQLTIAKGRVDSDPATRGKVSPRAVTAWDSSPEGRAEKAVQKRIPGVKHPGLDRWKGMADYGTGGGAKMASDEAIVQGILEAAKGSEDAVDTEEPGAEDTRYGGGKGARYGGGLGARYGGGLGNLKGKRAPKFTDKVNPTDLPQAFKQAAAKHGRGKGCNPKFGCGGGKHGTGCGMAKKAARPTPKSAPSAAWSGALDKGRSIAQGATVAPATARYNKLKKVQQDTRAAKAPPYKPSFDMQAAGNQPAKGSPSPASGATAGGRAAKAVAGMPAKVMAGAATLARAAKGKSAPKRRAAPQKMEVGEAKRVATNKPGPSSLGASAGGGLGGNMAPSFAGGRSTMPQRASMATLGKTPGFGSAGQLKAPTMPTFGGSPGGKPARAAVGGLPKKEDTTAPKSRTSLAGNAGA
jgi:hypothetical protein